MLQRHLCSLSGNGKRQRREEEEASCEAHHFGRWSVQSPRVAEGSKAFVGEREGETGDLLSCAWKIVQGLRHKFAASSALGRHRNKRFGARSPGTASKLDPAGRRIQVKRTSLHLKEHVAISHLMRGTELCIYAESDVSRLRRQLNMIACRASA